MVRLAIIGSRSFTDYERLYKELEPYKDKVSLVVSGGARGADKLGERWADENKIPKKIFPANWELYGKSAGFIRNKDIVLTSDCVIAFWDGVSVGTEHSMELAHKYKKPLKIIRV